MKFNPQKIFKSLSPEERYVMAQYKRADNGEYIDCPFSHEGVSYVGVMERLANRGLLDRELQQRQIEETVWDTNLAPVFVPSELFGSVRIIGASSTQKTVKRTITRITGRFRLSERGRKVLRWA